MLYDSAMDEKTFENYFAEWKDAISTDHHKVDFTTTVNNTPSDPDDACMALSRMIEELFAVSDKRLLFSQLSVVTARMHTYPSSIVIRSREEAFTRMLEGILVISHHYKKDEEITKTSELPAFIAQLENDRILNCVQFITGADVTLKLHEWYDFISNTLMGPYWHHISNLYGVDDMKTADLAHLMNTLHPLLLQSQNEKTESTEISMPVDFSQ